MIVWSTRKMLFSPHDIVRHNNFSHYRIVTHCLREHDNAECYAYRHVDGGAVWVRPADEMEDGRFTLVVKAEPKPDQLSDADDWKRHRQNYTQAILQMRAKAEATNEMANLLREAINNDINRDWYSRAHTALSLLQNATEDTTATNSEPHHPDATTGLSAAQTDICRECDTVLNMLLAKNRRYGNSALEPVRVFSQSNPVEQIRVRIDDKLSRISSRQADDDEDVVLDLIGYLILLRIARRAAADRTDAPDEQATDRRA